jgi:hypothetical protein
MRFCLNPGSNEIGKKFHGVWGHLFNIGINMQCPKCRFEQPETKAECLRCNIIFSDYLQLKKNPSPQSLSSAQVEDRVAVHK